MSKKGFTLIELLAVIILIAIMTLLIVPNVTKNIKEAKNLLKSSQIEAIESAAYLYSIDYASEIPTFASIDVATVTLETLITKGYLETGDITVNNVPLNTANTVVIANINNVTKTKYDENQTGDNIIFLKGLESVAINEGETYTDSGAYVAIVGTGVIELTGANMTSTVNTSVIGEYTVTYTYSDSISVVRTVNVI